MKIFAIQNSRENCITRVSTYVNTCVIILSPDQPMCHAGTLVMSLRVEPRIRG